jgi:hypothetical protein
MWYVESLENLYNAVDGDFLRRHHKSFASTMVAPGTGNSARDTIADATVFTWTGL